MSHGFYSDIGNYEGPPAGYYSRSGTAEADTSPKEAAWKATTLQKVSNLSGPSK